MVNRSSTITLFLAVSLLFACQEKQTSSNDKKIWANSFIGKKAPEFVVEQWLSEIPNTENKYVLIDFWATWCGPCRQVIPELNSYHEEFKDKLVVIGVSAESEEKIEQIKSLGINYYSAIAPQQTMYDNLGITAIPHCIIINPDGIVVWEGFPLLEGNELTAQVIKELINKG
ncbi:MAG: TlpA family protein disulfide reductase [Flammeovirgaceae bacterium]